MLAQMQKMAPLSDWPRSDLLKFGIFNIFPEKIQNSKPMYQ